MFMPAPFPPLHHRNEYLCFQKITKLEYSIPEGFPDNAKDVVTKLLVNSNIVHVHCAWCICGKSLHKILHQFVCILCLSVTVT